MSLKGFIGLLVVLLFFAVYFFYSLRKAEMEKSDLLNLERAVPSVDMYATTAHQLSVEELEQLNGFFTKIKEFTGVDRRSNPITLTGEEFNRIPASQRNVEIPKSVIFFRSGAYNSAGHALESQSGIFFSQAILYGNKADADLAENNLMEMTLTRKHYSVVYRKGNVVGAANMYRPGESTREIRGLVGFIKTNGFTVTEIPPFK